MIIELNAVEQRLAKHLAENRYKRNRDNGIKDRKIGPQSAEATDLEGIGAEIAFCKMHNIYPDMTLDDHPLEDAMTSNGKRVDIKTTKFKNGHLLAVMGKRTKKCDLYALMVGVFPCYRFAGVFSGDELFSSENIGNCGYGDCYKISQDRLKMQF